MASINLFFRASGKKERHEGSLCLRLIHNRQARSITLSGCRLHKEEWDWQKQGVIYPGNDPARAAYLEKVEQCINREVSLVGSYLSLLEKQGRYSVEDLTRLYRQGRDDGKLMSYGERLAFGLERRGQLRTARAYRTVTRGIVIFNSGRDIPLEHINARLVKDFESHLKEKGRLPNTISYYMRNLRAIYNKAAAEKRIAGYKGDNPFAGTCTGVTKTMKRTLSLDEIKKIHNLDFPALLEKERYGSKRYAHIESLGTAHRYFSFCFYARGMCFIDMAYLRKDNIRGGFIRYVRKKTGRQIEVRITPQIQEILSNFAMQVKDSPYLFPVISNRDGAKPKVKDARLQYETALRAQNSRLKRIAGLAGVHKPVSTHWARHTWATIGKQQNIPLRVISECLGHTSEKTTLIYLDSLDNSVLDAANEAVASALARPRMMDTATAAFF
jgi:integrase